MIKQTENDLKILIRAKYPLIYIVSYEENRVETMLLSISKQMQKNLYSWDVNNGLRIMNGDIYSNEVSANAILSSLEYAIESNENAIFLFKDLHPYIDVNSPIIVRKLRDLSLNAVKSKKSVILLSPILKIPIELEKEITIVDFPLPDINDLDSILKSICKSVQTNSQIKINIENNKDKERILKAALGLTATEAENVFAKALVMDRCLDINDVPIILDEKKQIIRKTGILEYYDSDETMENVGGLENLKEWIRKRTRTFSEEARGFGLPEPKGILLLGIQGCGKSLSAKAISSIWKLPLLRLDMGAIFGMWVGQSEENIRKAIKTAESISPVILWIDELEKGFASMSGSGDSGTSSRVFGTFLTWMQEKSKPVFIVATSNNVSSLPPELLRKGRFDEIFFIDLPNKKERGHIFNIHIKKRKKDTLKFDVESLAEQTDGYSGAEIEQIVVSALYDAFDENRELLITDLSTNIRKCIPLSQTMKEKIDWLKNWAQDRAIKASK